MRIALAADYYGFPIKEALSFFLRRDGHEVVDFGPASMEPDELLLERVDKACRALVEEQCDRAILACMSGGMAYMRANKWPGIRAVMGSSPSLLAHDREASDVNVLALSGRETSVFQAEELARVFLETPFEALERRVARLNKLELPTV